MTPREAASGLLPVKQRPVCEGVHGAGSRVFIEFALERTNDTVAESIACISMRIREEQCGTLCCASDV